VLVRVTLAFGMAAWVESTTEPERLALNWACADEDMAQRKIASTVRIGKPAHNLRRAAFRVVRDMVPPELVFQPAFIRPVVALGKRLSRCDYEPDTYALSSSKFGIVL